jgi:hypothetical protein
MRKLSFYELYCEVKKFNAENERLEPFSLQLNRRALVKFAGDDRELDQQFEGNYLEGVLVGRFEHHRARCSRLLNLKPAGCADAPAIAWLEAGEAVLRHGRREVVAQGLRSREEGLVDDAADGVDAEVIGSSLAAAGAVKAGHGVAAAGVEGLAEYIFSAGLVGFDGGHGPSLSSLVSHFRERVARAAL